MDTHYQIHAIRYAHLARSARHNFIDGDPHDGPMPLDYYVWAITGGGRSWVLDTGFDATMAAQRRRELLRPVGEGLKLIGIDPATVEDVIISHMHYDHAGNNDLFPNATFHIQDREMAFCTGRSMCHHAFSHSMAVDDVIGLVRRVFAGRVHFHDGDDEIASDLSLHFIGGHTMGLQSVRVMTRRGAVVLASDAAHLYAHLEQGRAYPVVYNVADMLEGHRTLQRLASSPRHIVPGHDPLVAKLYPAARAGLDGIVMRLDVEPVR
jgi:glyoxylase-like metal-dependent hydrolase (beta-lactamase superfamily II)